MVGLTTFVGGIGGRWRVVRIDPITGPPLEPVTRVAVLEGASPSPRHPGLWRLRGVTSYERYVTRPERELLTAREPALGRPPATCAALIPIRKSVAWWNLTQDERREILETRSGHIQTGLQYLPAVARRLYHSRALDEPFDFLTWFEYAPADAASFDALVDTLRRSEEWRYVEREVDIRLVNAAAP